ncbi:MAG: PxxKW family cysteine-rich protein [Deltaproteobacteria bacterium]|nr:PxxKW family cysteine-rich protein [Deltaproteobacteria bacterium]
MQSFFKPIVEKCEGCERIIAEENDKFCKTYANPAAKWRNGFCNFATHAKPEIVVQTVRVNPLKASKRASGK